MLKKIARVLAVVAVCAVCAAVGIIANINPDIAISAYGTDPVRTAEDVAEDDKLKDPVPAENAIELEWYGHYLEGDEKELYESIKSAILSLRPRVEVNPTMSEDEVSTIFWYVIFDHPEYFWVANTYFYYYEDGDHSKVNQFEMKYYYDDREKLLKDWERYDIMADTVLSGSHDSKSNVYNFRQIYTWVIYNTAYESTYRDQDISSVFDQKKSVCAGYVQAVQFMALRAGIPTVRITGQSFEPKNPDSNHTWLCAVENRELLYYDVTWDDRSYADAPLDKYYGMSYEELLSTHRIRGVLAPQKNGERDDTEEMVRTSRCIATGEHLELKEAVSVDWRNVMAGSWLGMAEMGVQECSSWQDFRSMFYDVHGNRIDSVSTPYQRFRNQNAAEKMQPYIEPREYVFQPEQENGGLGAMLGVAQMLGRRACLF